MRLRSFRGAAFLAMVGGHCASNIWSASPPEQPRLRSFDASPIHLNTSKDRLLGERQLGHGLREATTGFRSGSVHALKDSEREKMRAEADDSANSDRLLESILDTSMGGLGWFSQGDRFSLGLSDDQAINAGFDAQNRMRLRLLRSFKDIPEADFKLGPFFFDLRWMELSSSHRESWSSSGQHFSEEQLFATVAIETSLRVYDTLYFNFFSNLSYDFIEERLYGSANAGSSSNTFIGSFLYFTHNVGRWEWSALNQFRGLHMLNAYQNVWFEEGKDVDEGGFQTQDSSSSLQESLDHRYVRFVNKTQLAAGRSILEDQWYLTLRGNLTDYWSSFHFDDHALRRSYRGELAYRGSKLPFSPVLSYEALSYTDDRWMHRAQLDIQGRLIERVLLRGTIGHSFTDSDEFSGTYWRTQLRHQFSLKGWQSISVGQTLTDEEFQPQTTFQSYARYSLGYRATDQTYFALMYQWSADSKVWDDSLDDWGINDQSQHTLGLTHNWRMTQDAEIQNGVYTNFTDSSTRYSYLFQANRRFTDRVSVQAYYRMDQYESTHDQTVHHVGLTLRKSF